MKVEELKLRLRTPHGGTIEVLKEAKLVTEASARVTQAVELLTFSAPPSREFTLPDGTVMVEEEIPLGQAFCADCGGPVEHGKNCEKQKAEEAKRKKRIGARVKPPSKAELKRIDEELNGPKSKASTLPRVAVYGGDDSRLRQQVKWDRTALDVEFYAGTRADTRAQQRLATALKAGTFRHLVIMTGWAAHDATKHLKATAKNAGVTVQMAPSSVGASWVTEHLATGDW